MNSGDIFMIGFFSVAVLICWFPIASGHRNPYAHTVYVGYILGRLVGSKNGYVNPKSFTMQTLGISFIFWSLFFSQIDVSDKMDKVTLSALFITTVVHLLITIFCRRSNSD